MMNARDDFSTFSCKNISMGKSLDSIDCADVSRYVNIQNSSMSIMYRGITFLFLDFISNRTHFENVKFIYPIGN